MQPETNGDNSETMDLVHSAGCGNEDALNRLFARYYERVRSVVRRHLGPELRAHVETVDLVQETFAHAGRCFHRFEPRGSAAMINRLSRIAEHVILSEVSYRRAQCRDWHRCQSLWESLSQTLDPAFLDFSTMPEVSAIRQEDLSNLRHGLESLPPLYRELIRLRNYAGMSWAEIAARTGRPSSDAARMMHGTAMLELEQAVWWAANGGSGREGEAKPRIVDDP